MNSVPITDEATALREAKRQNALRVQMLAEGKTDYALNGNDHQANIYGFVGSLFRWKPESNVVFFSGVITDFTTDSAAALLEEMEGQKEIIINLTSPGGFADAGVAIANMFYAAKTKVIINVIGMAYSAASVALQGADQRNVAPGAMVGIHRAWSLTIGDYEAMAKEAEYLKVTDSLIMETYMMRVPKENKADLEEKVAKDTRMNGKAAVKLGLADKALNKKEMKEAMKDIGGAPNGMEEDEEKMMEEPKAEAKLPRIIGTGDTGEGGIIGPSDPNAKQPTWVDAAQAAEEPAKVYVTADELGIY